jgi:hypothetical protein
VAPFARIDFRVAVDIFPGDSFNPGVSGIPLPSGSASEPANAATTFLITEFGMEELLFGYTRG